VRIDGIYFDPIPALSGRLRSSTAIRVGFSAIDFPFVAPTGIVDHKFRPFPDEYGHSYGAAEYGYGGSIGEWDIRVPVLKDHLALTGGIAYADVRSYDGSYTESWGWTVRPIIKLGGAEIAPFAAVGRYLDVKPHPLVVVSGPDLPRPQPRRKYLGQDWAKLEADHENYGVTLKAPIAEGLSLRAGMFHAVGDRLVNFTEIFAIRDATGLASHRLIADPSQDVHSTSGEAMLAWRFGGGDWHHRIFAGYRARNRYTETGGSNVFDFGDVIYGQRDPEVKPDFAFTEVNAGRLRQSSWMLGYVGRLGSVADLNLGIQKARFRGKSRQGGTGQVTLSQDDPWLYNAMARVHLSKSLSLYAGTEKGLEDSGTAPENAVNRNEQLPATRTTQHEAGVRWKFHGGQLVVNAFEITKPYFAFNAGNRFVELGEESHRGIEASLAAHLGDRLNVLAGGVLMKPRVTGAAVDAGLVGSRPAGTPSVYARIDATYRTSILDGLTATASVVHTGRRAVSSRPLAALGDKQLFTGSRTTVDLGARHHFHIGPTDFSIRAVLQNAFNTGGWKVVSANVVWPEEQRRYTIALAADF
ncbi:MAG: TonB-dependent receptor, partial [Novosphingobium sp.]|nr:TonB-dependent receptor [Novosphingobium sp.]